MSYRKYLTGLVAGVFALIILCISAVVIIDPGFQYHLPFKGIQSVYSNERYQNAGIAKNFDYDSVILGSSVTSNFKVSQFDKLFGGKTVKLSFPGGCFSDFDTALSFAYSTHDIKRVFWSLDPKILMTDYDQKSTPLPEYLYNNSIFDDAKYVLNKDVLLELCAESVIATLKNTGEDFDEAFMWDDQYEFSHSHALWGYVRPEWSETVQPADAFDDIVNKNLECVLKYVKEHPETEFYLFTPPYSTLYWDRVTRDGTYNAVLKLFDRLLFELAEYENVKYYCFATDAVVLDLNNYIDEVHYSAEVNEKMVEYMANNPPMDKNFVYHMHAFFREIVEIYNYESLFPVAVQDLPMKHRTVDPYY